MPRKKSKQGRTIKRSMKVKMPSGDLVSIQVAAIVKRPVGVKLTAALLEQMVRHKAETSDGTWTKDGVIDASEGEDPKGIKLKIISWKNPDRKKSKDQKSRNYGSQADRWGSLRRAIAGSTFAFQPLGSVKRKGKR